MRVLTEDATLQAVLAGRSLARVGEGELKLAVQGMSLKSQVHEPRLAAAILGVLRGPTAALVGVPRHWETMPNRPFWDRFEHPRFTGHYRQAEYGSAFISRPDMANAIDRPDYWAACRALWAGKDVVLAARSPKVLNLSAARGVRFVPCPAVGAWAEVDRIEAEIGAPAGSVLLAIGATATVLAERLAKKGVHAVDVGHMGRFMAAEGAWSVERQALISDGYVLQNRALHKRPEGYGGSGRKSAAVVAAFAAELTAERVLDYGCGQGTLRTALKAAGFAADVMEYDPAIKGKDGLPKPAELVVCTDVLEHIEPEKLDAVLAHLRRLTLHAAFFLIALRPANKTLPDGRNAHLIVRDAAWWTERLLAAGFTITRADAKPGHEARFWCSG